MNINQFLNLKYNILTSIYRILFDKNNNLYYLFHIIFKDKFKYIELHSNEVNIKYQIDLTKENLKKSNTKPTDNKFTLPVNNKFTPPTGNIFIPKLTDNIFTQPINNIFTPKQNDKIGCVGLYNLKTSCYANSVFQSILHIDILINYFINLKFNIDNLNELQKEFCLFFLLYWNNEHKVLSVEKLNLFINFITERKQKGDQVGRNDIDEFIIYLLDALDLDILNDNIFCKIGRMIDNVRSETISDQNIFDVSYNQTINNLLDYIKYNFEEELSYSDKLGKNQIIKQILYTLPNILIIRFKRERVIRKDKSINVVNKKIFIPHEIDLKDLIDGDEKNTKYYLNSFIEYTGAHYYSYNKNIDDNWYVYDDDSVKKINIYNNGFYSDNNRLVIYIRKNN